MNIEKSSDLRRKEVINIKDGKRLGLIIDFEIEMPEGRIISIVVPGPARFWQSLFRFDRSCIVICWKHICKIGDDVILVELDPGFFMHE